MTIVAGHQPNYLPNLDYFAKMAEADRFVIFTNVQFNKHDWQRRNRIPRDGQDIWLSVSVRKPSRDDCVHQIQTDDSSNWRRKHASHLRAVYGKTAEQAVLQAVLAIYERPWSHLADLNCALIALTRDALEITTPATRDDDVAGYKEELLAAIAEKYGATVYLSGNGAREYMTDDRVQWLAAQGVQHRFATAALGASHPYAALHYIFMNGAAATIDKLCTANAAQEPALAL